MNTKDATTLWNELEYAKATPDVHKVSFLAGQFAFKQKHRQFFVDSVVKKKKIRSNNQNSYYWGVVIELISEHTGYTSEEAHDAMKHLFLIDYSTKLPRIRSTTELSTAEYEDYLSKIRMFASRELSLYIPDPNSPLL